MEEIYTRQKEINLNQLQKVVIAGVGGVGSWVSLFIAETGIAEEIFLVDPDTVEASNLNRTPYKWSHIGTKKVYAMAELIAERRPLQKVFPIDSRIEAYNIPEYALFLDCRDTVDELSQKSPIIGGYDKDNISISIGYKNSLIFDSGIDRHGYTGTWLIPPVLLATVIVYYIAMCSKKNETINKTISVQEIVNNIIGG